MNSPTDPSMFQLRKNGERKLKANVGKRFQALSQCCLTSTQEQLIQHKFLKQVFQVLSLRTSSGHFSVTTSTTKKVHLSMLLSPHCIFCFTDHKDFAVYPVFITLTECQHFHLIQSGMSALSYCAFLCYVW